jgi:hypothetical protein
MNLTLAQIVTTDPDNRGYASMTDGQIEADIRDKRHTKRAPLPLPLFTKALFDRGIVLSLTQAELNSNHAAHAVAVLALKFVENSRDNGLGEVDMDRLDVITMMNAMVTAGLMTQTDYDEIDATATQVASLADLNNLAPFTHLDIATITGGTN